MLRCDPYGIRSLYIARVPDGWAASTDFDVLLSLLDEPRVDEETFVDFVAFRHALDVERTPVRGIRRVPPGSVVALTTDGPEVLSAYEPPPTRLIDGRESHQIVREFWDLLVEATADRLRGSDDVVLLLSGGVDSTALAAAAVEVCEPRRIRAVTFSCVEHFDDPEPAVARRTARHLGIDWQVVEIGRRPPFAPWRPGPRGLPVPPASSTSRRLHELTAGATVLYGWGGDLVTRGDDRHWPSRLRSGSWLRAAEDALRTMVLHGRRPGFRASKKRDIAPPDVGHLPLADRFRGVLRQRADRVAAVERGWRRGVDRLHAPVYPSAFELLQPNGAYTFPYFDNRLVEWAVGVPTAPWFIDKEVIRAALRGRVPDTVRLRPKTPVAGAIRFDVEPRDREAFEAVLATEEVSHWLDVEACRELLGRETIGVSMAGMLSRAISGARVVAEVTEYDDPLSSTRRPWELP